MNPAVFVSCWVAFYLSVALATARVLYPRYRPYTEPLSCPDPELHGRTGGHFRACYRRPGSVCTTQGDTVARSLMVGMAWWIWGLVWVVSRVVKSADRPTREELEAANARLERELGIGQPDPPAGQTRRPTIVQAARGAYQGWRSYW